MSYLEKLEIELVMAHANNGWYNEWLKDKIKQIKLRNGKSNKNS